VLAAVLSSYLYLSRQLARLAHQQTLETEGRRALGYFTQDVQRASGVDTSLTVSASRVSLTVPSATGTNLTVTYYYNPDLTDTATVSINGTNITMPAASLTRCVYNGSTVTSQTLLRYITARATSTRATRTTCRASSSSPSSSPPRPASPTAARRRRCTG
jgi:Tfp pilus assembly protein PilW